jgi:hypothetical protein
MRVLRRIMLLATLVLLVEIFLYFCLNKLR